jgi:hypothetical protein
MPSPRAPRFRPAVERLEARETPATFTVTTAADSALSPVAGSLRQAILDANANPGADNIAFAVGTGPVTITVAAALPAITGPTAILGNTQPGLTAPSNVNPDTFFNTPFPLVTLNGATAGAGADGLSFQAGAAGSQVQYLQVLNFGGNGIVFNNSANGLVTYTVASGNGGNGVLVTGSGATANRFQNMFVGVDKTGNTAVPNGGDGFRFDNLASGNVIGGGNFFQARCIVSGNLGNGVRITGGAFGNLEQGNVIGLNTGNDKALGNGLDGVLVEGSGANNVIGGPIGLGGIKAANGRHGVSIMGESPGTVVFNTFGGTSAFSNRTFGNGVDGIHVEASGAGIILTTNITSGNGRYGTYIGGNANGVIVNALLSGVGFPGSTNVAIPNGVAGVIVTDNARNTQFGTTAVPAAIAALFPTVAGVGSGQLRSIVAGNAGPGLVVEGNASGTRVVNTNFGAAVGGEAFPNAGPSVLVRGNATGTVITSAVPGGPVRITNDPAGVVVQTANPVTLTQNPIFDVPGLAIDTRGQGAAAQTPPRVTTAQQTAAGVVVAGVATGPANTRITVELFASPSAGEAEEFLTALGVLTDAAGVGRFSVTVRPSAGNTLITATATGATGNTSMLSNSALVLRNPVVVTGADAGGGPQVQVVFPGSTAPGLSFFAYEASFTGGVRVAAGDLTGDGVADIVTAPGPGGGPVVRVFDGLTGLPVREVMAYDPSFRGGLFVATGDVNGDGAADIITGADAGGGPNVKVFSGVDGSLLASFFAFDPGFRGGVRVAAGDVNGDGVADVIAGAGPGGPPLVRAFGGAGFAPLASLTAFDAGYTGGVYVAAGDLSGLGVADVIVGQGTGGSDVRWFDAAGNQRGQLAAFPGFAGGARVATVNSAGRTAIVAAAGPGGSPRVATFTPDPVAGIDSFFAYAESFTGGVFVGGTR